jgi:hypothetical protein
MMTNLNLITKNRDIIIEEKINTDADETKYFHWSDNPEWGERKKDKLWSGKYDSKKTYVSKDPFSSSGHGNHLYVFDLPDEKMKDDPDPIGTEHEFMHGKWKMIDKNLLGDPLNKIGKREPKHIERLVSLHGIINQMKGREKSGYIKSGTTDTFIKALESNDIEALKNMQLGKMEWEHEIQEDPKRASKLYKKLNSIEKTHGDLYDYLGRKVDRAGTNKSYKGKS